MAENGPNKLQSHETQHRIMLDILDAVHNDAELSQRSLAKELGIALGLTNAYLKTCVRKGLIKVRHAPANRYAYYLTPKGFSEKSRLTARFLARSFNFYRQAREEMASCLSACEARGWRRIALAGTGDLAEIAILMATQHAVELIAVVDEKAEERKFMSLVVVPDTAAIPDLDAILVTDVARPQKTFESVARTFDERRIVTPALLKISRVTGTDTEPQ